MNWFAKAKDIDAAACSRYGYRNVGIDELQCVKCDTFLVCKIDDALGNDVRSYSTLLYERYMLCYMVLLLTAASSHGLYCEYCMLSDIIMVFVCRHT